MTETLASSLRRLRGRTLSQTVAREGLDAFEAVGPWLLTLLCLAAMGLSTYVFTGQAPVRFYLMLTYATALSLIVTAPLHTMLNRHLADEIYLGRLRSIVGGLLALTLLAVAACLATAGLLAFGVSRLPLHLKISFVGLTALMGLFWCISALICALRRERLLLYLFIAGMGTSLVLFGLLRPSAAQPLVLIFGAGVAVPVAGCYAYVIKVYLRDTVRLDWAFLRRPRNLRLAAALLAFNLAFWVDKFIFWFAPSTGKAHDPLLRYAADYDFPFFAALTLMMVGSVLVYRGIKRRVSGPYEAFIFKLANNFPFRELALEKMRLVNGIGQVSTGLLVFYGGLAVFALLLVHLQVVPLPWRNPFVFHYLLLGTVFFSLFFLYFLVLQYLDDIDGLLRICLLFLGLNAAGTAVSLHFGWKYYGTGFLFAAVVIAVVAFAMVNRTVGGLEYEVFKKALREQQAVAGERQEAE